uniref:Secreted protein n=1 Tax=Spermophilus dauricus TaxID=99837 RepID=A0A8C9PQH3_SPEDA
LYLKGFLLLSAGSQAVPPHAATPCSLCMTSLWWVLGWVHTVWGVLWDPRSLLTSALSPGELLQWLAGRHLLHGLVVDGDTVLVPGPGGQGMVRQALTTSGPVCRCCLCGCTQQDLRALCPH